MADPARHIVVSVLLLGLVFAVPGCKAVRSWFSPAEQATLGEPGPTERLSGSTLSDPETRQGLAVRLLVVDDTDYDAARLLNTISPNPGTQSPIDEHTRETWSRWGFRLVAVPVEGLDSALAELTPVRPLSVQWLGEFGAWRPLVRSGVSDQTRVRVGESSRSIVPGRARLIARSWSAPQLDEQGVVHVLRLDLGIQIEEVRSSGFSLLPDQRQRTLDDEGQVIDELLSSLTLRGDYALVIVGEAPGADWDQLPEPMPLAVPDTGDDQRVGPREYEDRAGPSAPSDPPMQSESGKPREAAPVAAPSRASLEPSVPAMPSLGELMLVAPGSRMMRLGEARNIPKRVVIVLVPSVRGSYRVINAPARGLEGAS